DAYATAIAGAADPLNPTPAEIEAATAAAEAAGVQVASAEAVLAATQASRAQFDPSDSSTYNSSTSVTVYDSLGNSHVMSKYFVKADASTWDLHILLARLNADGALAAARAFPWARRGVVCNEG